MTQVSHPRRTRILQASTLAPEEVPHCQEQRDAFAIKCRAVFERLRPILIETHYNWHIAINPEIEQYLIDPTFSGIRDFQINNYPIAFKAGEQGAGSRGRESRFDSVKLDNLFLGVP